MARDEKQNDRRAGDENRDGDPKSSHEWLGEVERLCDRSQVACD